MFLCLSKPTPMQIETIVEQTRTLPYNYPDVGCTNAMPVPVALSTAYAMDHNRIQLGTGQVTFEQARQALLQWRMCNLGWATICGRVQTIAPGAVIACVPTLFGLWLINPCRVVYTIDEQVDGVTRFGLAYGTLPGHVAAGEERFLVEWHHADDSVWYDILAFSQPSGYLARIGYPVMRHFQIRYGCDSVRAMASICNQKECLTDSNSYGNVLETFPALFSP